MELKVCLGCMTEGINSFPCPVCGWDNESEPESYLYLKSGSILNNQYLIGRVLGHGGFGITYLALDTRLRIKLAIKEYLPREYAGRDSSEATVSVHSGTAKAEFAYGLEKFLEEAQNVARFQGHPGIVGVLNFFEANGTGYMVMPYVEGTTLKEYLQSQSEQKISYEKAIGIFMPVLDALREVHHGGMLHRDISPDNIYITSAGQVKLLDFGAARFAIGEHSKSLSIVLKPGYSPREQYSSKGKQGAWTDIYAVAASLYRSITGIVPDDALDRLEEDELKAPGELVSINPEAQQAILTAMSVNARDRFQTIEAFQAALFENQQTNIEPAPAIPFAPEQPPSLPQQSSDTSPSIKQADIDVTIIDTVRRRLIRQGYKIKAAGPLDERTIAAIEQFEQENNLPVVGKVDEVLAEEVAEKYFELENTEWVTFLTDFDHVLDEPEKAKSLIVAYLDRWSDTRHQVDIDKKYWDCVYQYASGNRAPDLLDQYLSIFPEGVFKPEIPKSKAEIQKELEELLIAVEESLWASSLESLDISVVDEYKQEYPQGKYINEVDERKEKIIWEKVIQRNDKDSYCNYLNQFQNGEFSEVATEKLDELLWNQANESFDFEEYLERFPESPRANTVPEIIERRAWELLQYRERYEDFEEKTREFIGRFSDGVFVVESIKLLEKICWEKSITLGTDEAFDEFESEFGGSVYVEQIPGEKIKILERKEQERKTTRVVSTFILGAGVAFFLYVLWGYSQIDNDAFAKAKSANRISSYEAFIRKHPDSEFSGRAQLEIKEIERKDKLAYTNALNHKRIDKLENYIKKSAEKLFKSEAEKILSF